MAFFYCSLNIRGYKGQAQCVLRFATQPLHPCIFRLFLKYATARGTRLLLGLMEPSNLKTTSFILEKIIRTAPLNLNTNTLRITAETGVAPVRNNRCMIGQQGPRIACRLRIQEQFSESIDEVFSIGVIFEDCLPFDPTDDDMLQRAGRIDSRLTRHER